MRRLTALLAACVALTGCGGQEPPPATTTQTQPTQEMRTPMSDATTLKENLPTQVNGVRLIAYNIEQDRAGLHLGSDKRAITLDETISVGGSDYTVAELVPTDAARGEHPNGWVSLIADRTS